MGRRHHYRKESSIGFWLLLAAGAAVGGFVLPAIVEIHPGRGAGIGVLVALVLWPVAAAR